MSIQTNETQVKSFPRIDIYISHSQHDIYISHSQHIETIVKSIRHTALSHGVECRETPSISKCIRDRVWCYEIMTATYYEEKKIVVIGVSRPAGSTAAAFLSRPDSIVMALKLIITNHNTVLFYVKDLEREIETNIPEITKNLAHLIIESLPDIQFSRKENAVIMNRDFSPTRYYGNTYLPSKWENVNVNKDYVPIMSDPSGITNLLMHPGISEKKARITFVKKSYFEEIIGFDLEKFKSIVPQSSIDRFKSGSDNALKAWKLISRNDLLMIAGRLYNEKDFKQHTDLSRELFHHIVFKANDTIMGSSDRITLCQFKCNEEDVSTGEFTSPYGMLLENNSKSFTASEDGSMKLCDMYVAPVTDFGKIRKYNLIFKEQKLKITEQ